MFLYNFFVLNILYLIIFLRFLMFLYFVFLEVEYVVWFLFFVRGLFRFEWKMLVVDRGRKFLYVIGIVFSLFVLISLFSDSIGYLFGDRFVLVGLVV